MSADATPTPADSTEAMSDAPSDVASGDVSGDVSTVSDVREAAVDTPMPVGDSGMRRTWIPVRCAGENEAPLRDGTGPENVNCTRVGADLTSAPGGWPAATTLRSPVVYVDSTAAPGGDGVMGRPFNSLPDAFSALPASGGSVIARGAFTLSGPLTARGDVILVGTGPTRGTTITIPHGQSGLSIAGSSGALRLRGLSLRYVGGAPSDADVALSASGGALLQANEVSIEDAGNGIRADGSTVNAESVSVLRPTRIGVLLTRGRGVLRRILVRDGLLQGIRADAAHLDLRESMVMNQGRQGVQLFNDADTSGGARDCTTGTTGGSHDCLERVVSIGNTSAALYIENSRTVEARLLSLSATRSGAIMDGDGLVLANGASVLVDTDLADAPRNQGRGSEIVGNARAGVVAQGLGVSLSIRGALIASNGGPGVFLADNALGREVLASAVVGNVGLGVGSTPSASLVSIQCNGIFDTRMGAVATDRGMLMVGDGLSVSMAGMGVSAVANEFTGNARFGAVANEVGGLASGNYGEGNGFSGVAAYGALRPMDDGTNRIRGAAMPPAERPPLANGSP